MPAKRSTNLKKSSSGQRLCPVPSFAGRAPSSSRASVVKSRNRSKDTRAEVLLRKALTQHGLRYRIHVSSLPGRPDIVFSRPQIAVFCDGDFWHGRNWRARRSRLNRGANADYWTQKIRYNIDRDRRQTRELERAGWVVVRLWETDVLRSPRSAVRRVKEALHKRTSSTRS